MQQRIAIALLCIITLPVMHKVFTIADYVIHQEYIAEVLCINKEEPELKCNGKCHLAKELNKSENSEKENKNSNNTKIDLPISILNVCTFCEKIVFINQSKLIKDNYLANYSFLFTHRINKPPITL